MKSVYKATTAYRFLIADDNINIQRVLKEMLLKVGDVETASNGADALQRTQERTFDVIITDVNMPVMTGLDFYQQAVEIKPTLRGRFIFCSGDLMIEQDSFFKEQGLQLLEKPFDMLQMLKMVMDILDGTSNSLTNNTLDTYKETK